MRVFRRGHARPAVHQETVLVRGPSLSPSLVRSGRPRRVKLGHETMECGRHALGFWVIYYYR